MQGARVYTSLLPSQGILAGENFDRFILETILVGDCFQA